jgi:tyrosyl-tRNA synthetase
LTLAGKPNEAKKKLGAAIVAWFHGDAAAEQVQADWAKQFSKGEDPDDMPEVTLSGGSQSVLDVMVAAGFCKSKGEARKKVEEGAFNSGPERTKPADFKAMLDITDGLVIRLGRKVARLRVTP